MIVRPFSTSDVNSLIDSFDRWDALPPCTDPSQLSESVDLVLYLSRNVSSEDNRTLSVRTTVDAFLQEAVPAKPWRSCFNSVSLLGANLTEAQDMYRSSHGAHDVTWNLGPNLQFYFMLQYYATANVDVLFMMESDTIPLAPEWLQGLLNTKGALGPFSVVGSQYSGYKWRFLRSLLKRSLLDHLNGNALYNLSSPLLRSELDTFDVNEWETVLHSSFDVRFAEVVYDEESGVDTPEEAEQAFGYKQTATMSNHAASFVVPQDICAETCFIHGANYMRDWSTRCCAGDPSYTGVYPKPCIADSENASLTLIVTDFGTGSLDTFMANLTRTRQALADAQTNPDTCKHLDTCASYSLPFDEIIVVTPAASLAEYQATYSDPTVTFMARSRENYSAWWDICSTPVNTTWFMQVTSFFSFVDDFRLVVHTDVNGTLMPLSPYIEHDSDYCGRECRKEINDTRQSIHSGANRRYLQSHSVYNTAIRDQYCSELTEVSLPGPTSYFAYIDREYYDCQPHQTCNGQPDPAECRGSQMKSACTQDSLVGIHARETCLIACNTCVSGDESEGRMLSTTERFLEGSLRTEGSGCTKGGSPYYAHDMVRQPPMPSFLGVDEVACEDSGDFAACPCVFPFIYDNQSYSECLVFDE